MGRKLSKIIAGVVTFAFFTVTPTVAFAQTRSTGSSKDETIARLVELNPGSTYKEMQTSIKKAAKESGKSEKTVAKEALKESLRAALPMAAASGPDGTIPLTTARHKGDIFFTPATTFFVHHGHTGIYRDRKTIIEATPGHGVWRTGLKGVLVSRGALLQEVNTSQVKRDRAADRANTYVGRMYNPNFAFNKTANGWMNCSQVVWAAYKTASGIDLDSNGGHGVYPKDIRDSRLTRTYKRF